MSSTHPYRFSVCRLGREIDDPSSDEILERSTVSDPRQQPIHPGSYVHVEDRLARSSIDAGLTLEIWVRPWRLDGSQAILTQHDDPEGGGVGLFLDDDGRVVFYLGDGAAVSGERLHRGPRLQIRRWHHLVGTWDGAEKALWVDGYRVGRWSETGPVAPGPAPLRLGAAGERGRATRFLDGDLAMPAIYGRSLPSEEIRSRHLERGLRCPDESSLLAVWTLREESGSVIEDSSPHARRGRIVNRGTWMIGGPSFDGSPPRYSDYDPAEDSDRGHGLRLASDDLYDCRWEVRHGVRLPEDSSSGIYVGRFSWKDGADRYVYDVTFLVRKPEDRPKAPILFLCPTNTWRAYATTPFARPSPGIHQVWSPQGRPNSPGSPPAFSMYEDHEAGQPTYQMGLRMPWPAAGPYVVNDPEEVGFSHLARANRFTQAWLEENGYDYDMASDVDLHRDPGLLDGYEVLLIDGHSEYWTAEAYRAVDRYLQRGGDVVALSGNTMFWRVSFDDDDRVMECRKFDTTVAGRPNASYGEIWHSQDGRKGGLMRECGHPAWKVLGLECVGWWGTDADDFGVYRVDSPDHLLLREPESTQPERGSTIGHAQDGGVPRAVGHEGDVRLATLRRMTPAPWPDDATIPEEPDGIVTLAAGVRDDDEAVTFDYFGRPAPPVDDLFCEMIYWDRPRGGRVFHAGAVGAGWALSVDPKLQRLVRNALAHFGVPKEIA